MRRTIDSVLTRLGTPRRATRLLAGLPVVLFAIPSVATVVVFGPAGLLYPPVLMAVGGHALWVLGQLYGVYRIHRDPLAAERYPRLLAWYLGIGLAFFLINAVGSLTAPTFDPLQSLGWLTFSANMGAGIGLLVGLTEARAIDRAVAAEHEATEASVLAAQRDRFEFMNAILRHEVLNNVQVIQGQAEYLLADEPGEEVSDGLAVISRQSADMADVVEEIRVVSRGLERTEMDPIDLEFVLRAELTDLRDAHPEVETDLSIPEDVAVLADGLLARVFSNLFANAVEHNDADVPRIAVTVEVDEAIVSVAIADNGSGVSEAVRRTLFDHSRGPHGVGLYLVDTLVSNYGGDIELTETGPEGSVFTVELRRATDAAGAAERARQSVPDPAEVQAPVTGGDGTNDHATESGNAPAVGDTERRDAARSAVDRVAPTDDGRD